MENSLFEFLCHAFAFLDMTEAKIILRRNIDKYEKSTLFIYFQGRLERIEVNECEL